MLWGLHFEDDMIPRKILVMHVRVGTITCPYVGDLNSENFTKSGMLETFSSPVDEDVLVILLRTGLSSVLVV